MSGTVGSGPTVMYITGWCRTGSTILGNLLGALPAVAHVGELHYLWRNGVLRSGTNTSCGCGQPLDVCPLWSKVIARLAPGDPVDLARRIVAGQLSYLRTRHARRRLAEVLGRRPVPVGVLVEVDRMVDTYRAVADETAARLIVDSSKYPAEAAALLGRPEVDLRVLHLVRDPRATAHSWRHSKSYIPAMGVLRSTGYWTAANLASDRIGRAFPDRYLRLCYEDFTARPRAALTRVINLAGLADQPPIDTDGRALVGVNHTVTGNPDRLLRGPVRVHPDVAWRAELPVHAALVATALAAPALRRYGYPWTRSGRWTSG